MQFDPVGKFSWPSIAPDPHPENSALGKLDGHGVSGSLEPDATGATDPCGAVMATGVPRHPVDGLVKRQIVKGHPPETEHPAQIFTPRSLVGVQYAHHGPLLPAKPAPGYKSIGLLTPVLAVELAPLSALPGLLQPVPPP